MKKLLKLAAALALAALFAPAGASAAELIPVYSPPPGGTYFVLGAGLVTVSNRFMPETKYVQEATTGTLEILRKMAARANEGKPAFGLCGTPDGWRAWKGLAEYAKTPFPTMRAVVSGPGTDVYLIVPAKSPIKSYADCKGKRLGMGGPGSTPANTAHFLLEQHGVKREDFKPFYYTYKETSEGIQDGSLDGGFLIGSYPVASILELSSRTDIRIVPIDENILKTALHEHPYYYKNVVKKGAYKGVDADIPVMGFGGSVWTHAGVPDDVVYKFVKNLFEHKEDFYAINPAARWMTHQTAMFQPTVPWHPGALKYFKEVGLTK
jgi:TRAP transporter TAXI family solute receptor